MALIPGELPAGAEERSKWREQFSDVLYEVSYLIDEAEEAANFRQVTRRWELRESLGELRVRPVPVPGYDEPSKSDLLLCQLQLVSVQRDPFLLTSCQELPYMLDVFLSGSAENDHVVNDIPEPDQLFERLIHPTVIMLSDRGHSVRGTEEGESTEGCCGSGQ